MATKTSKNRNAAKAEKTKRTGTCLVTGKPTAGGNFLPGMDARLKGMLIRVVRGENSLNSVPKAALARLRENGAEGLVGFRLNGDKLTKIGNFEIAENGKAKKGSKAKKELNSKAAFAKGSKGKSAKARRRDEAARKLAKHRAATEEADEAAEGVEEESEEEE